MAKRTEYVTFLSPGTFFHEETTRKIASRDIGEAALMAQSITERHAAKPFGFYFKTMIEADPVPDGEGGTLEVQPKEVSRSGTYYLGGVLLTVDDLKSLRDESRRILIANMESNDWPVVIENCNSWRVTQPFNEGDFVVDPSNGRIARRGDEPELVDYRARKIRDHREEMKRIYG